MIMIGLDGLRSNTAGIPAIKPGTKMSISLIENVEECEMKIDVNTSLISRNSSLCLCGGIITCQSWLEHEFCAF